MVIELTGISKKYRTWIFKDISFTFQNQQKYAVTGRNGAGKSTLLKIISGYTTPTMGDVRYYLDGTVMDREQYPLHISYTAPYIGLIEELTVREHIDFQRKFKCFQDDLSTDDLLAESQLRSHQQKFVSQLSSGLMQRLKLTLVMTSDADVMLLDEPTSYLDSQARIWFESIFNKYTRDKLVIIATNDERDVSLCKDVFNVEHFVPAVGEVQE